MSQAALIEVAPVLTPIQVSNWITRLDEKGNPTGLLGYEGQRKHDEVRNDLIQCLKDYPIPEHDSNAYGIAEWVSVADDLPNDEYPNGRTFITCCSGSNEGVLIKVMVEDFENHKIFDVFTIKYFLEKPDAWAIVIALDDAFERAC